jgi:hypothetical protein
MPHQRVGRVCVRGSLNTGTFSPRLLSDWVRERAVNAGGKKRSNSGDSTLSSSWLPKNITATGFLTAAVADAGKFGWIIMVHRILAVPMPERPKFWPSKLVPANNSEFHAIP